MNSNRRIHDPIMLQRQEGYNTSLLPKHLASSTTRPNMSSIAWQVVFVLCFLICFGCALYQVIILLQIYLKYPYTVAVSIQTNERITLPGITFCSSIGVRRSALEKMKGFTQTIKDLEEEFNKTGRIDKTKRQEAVDVFYFKYMKDTPLDMMAIQGLNFSEFIKIKETKCALDDVLGPDGKKAEDGIQCRNELRHEYIETFQGTSICWTLFHETKPSKLTQVQVPSGDTQSAVFIRDIPDQDTKKGSLNDDGENPVGSEESEDQPIQPLEVIRFMINFTQVESLRFDTPATGSVSVHDPDQIRMGRLQSIPLRPGKYYEIYIEETESLLLPFPYDTDCYAFRNLNLGSYEKSSDPSVLPPHPLFDKPLSTSDCIYGCLGSETIEKCGCWPPEIPYVRASLYKHLDLDLDDISMCDWIRLGVKKVKQTGQQGSIKDIGMTFFYKCFASPVIINTCRQKCKRECVRRRIKASAQDSIWPAVERINYAPPDHEKKLIQYQNCCAIVSIRLASNEITTYTYAAKYELVELVSYIGGIVSLWFGFTFIGIFDYLQSLVKLIVKKKNESLMRKLPMMRAILLRTRPQIKNNTAINTNEIIKQNQQVLWNTDFEGRHDKDRSKAMRTFLEAKIKEKYGPRSSFLVDHYDLRK